MYNTEVKILLEESTIRAVWARTEYSDYIRMKVHFKCSKALSKILMGLIEKSAKLTKSRKYGDLDDDIQYREP